MPPKRNLCCPVLIQSLLQKSRKSIPRTFSVAVEGTSRRRCNGAELLPERRVSSSRYSILTNTAIHPDGGIGSSTTCRQQPQVFPRGLVWSTAPSFRQERCKGALTSATTRITDRVPTKEIHLTATHSPSM